MSLYRLVTLGLLPLLAACAPVDLLNATVSRSGLSVTRGVEYERGPRGKLDIYRPAGATRKLPVIVFIYGGSWRSGARDDYLFVAATLARQGLVVVVPDYRVYPATRFPGFIQDSARAVAWTQSHAGMVGGDSNAVFLMGHSAGAYNVAMVALDPSFLRAAGGDRDRLAGWIGLAGPYDFLPIGDPDIIPIFAGAEPALTQPITFADGRGPPALLLTGSDDTTVLPRNSLTLARKITSAGGVAGSKIYPGIGHIGIILAIAPGFRGKAPVLADVTSFIADAVKRQARSAAGASR